MAKSKHFNHLSTIDQVLTTAIKKEIIHLTPEDESLNGRTIKIKNRDLVNFGSCSYLGLEMHPALKKGAIEGTEKYGTQFSSSRAYLSSPQYGELEYFLSEIFDAYVIATPSTSLGHIAAIPVLVGDEDAVILDHQVHASVQTAVQLLKPRGIHMEMIRHNRLDILEEFIITNRDKYKNIWYMADGVYSMYGDSAPLTELYALMDKYPFFRLYIDDAHGMSWTGKNGKGHVLSHIDLHKQMVMTTSLNKSFAAAGGALIFPEYELKRKIRTCGSVLIFSGPIQPPMLGAGIASAKLHLSGEITVVQDELLKRMSHTKTLLATYNLPLINEGLSPVSFVGVGLPAVGYNMVKRLMNEGFFVNLGMFPAVPTKCTGLRFTNTTHQKLSDIEAMIQAMAHHLPLALEEENSSIDDVYKSFKLQKIEKKEGTIQHTYSAKKSKLTLEQYGTILEINKEEWDYLFENRGTFDWDGLNFMEKALTGNDKPEYNWDFNYFIIRDEDQSPVLATFFTTALYKDDMLAHESVSKQIEEKRKTDPYYLVSKTISMGSLSSEGHHLYINRNNPEWKNALNILLNKVEKEQEKAQCNSCLLRDFDDGDQELTDHFLERGFVKVNMPGSNHITDLSWSSTEEFLQTISARNRRHFRNEVLKFENYFDVDVKQQLTNEEADYFYQLYNNVRLRNLGINAFPYPKNIVKHMSETSRWEFIVLRLKPEFETRPNPKPLGVVWCYKGKAHYCPMVVGIDYDFNYQFGTYRQAIHRVIQRSKELGVTKIFLGLSADIEKRKFGAKLTPRIAFVQSKDHYNMEVINSIAVVEEKFIA